VRPAPAKLTAQVHWIEVDPAYFDKLQREVWRLLPIMLLGAAVIAGMQWFLPQSAHRRDEGWFIPIIVLAIACAIFPFVGRIARHNLKGYRLGASTAGMHYEKSAAQSPFGLARSGRVPWRDVRYDGRFLLAGNRMLSVRPKGTLLFREDELETWIVANVPRDNRLSRLGLMWASGPVRVAMIVALAAAMAGVAAALYAGSL
jgi:hypothetical protein